MKATLILLALACATLMAKADMEETVCNTWAGFGEGLTSVQCAQSINTTCASIFDVIPELIEFFKTMDFSKLGKLIADLYTSVWESIKQWNICSYFKYLVNFIPHIIKFFEDIFNNWIKIKDYAVCFYTCFVNGDYYQAGICLGHVAKVILSD